MERIRQARAHRSRLRLIESALEAFADRGFNDASLRSIADAAGVSVGLTCRYFPTKEHLALAIYGRIADELAEHLLELPAGTVAERFGSMMERKLALISGHRRALTALAARAIDPEARAGVLGEAAEPVRARVTGIFAAVVRGASDAPDDPERLTRVLYGCHLALILLWLQGGERATAHLVPLAGELARWLPALVSFAPPALVEQLEAALGERLPRASRDDGATARLVVERIFRRRRVYADVADAPSEAAFAPHVPRALAAIAAGRPITLVLPAFPAKSPNPEKVLGPRPDAAEGLALQGLASMLDELEQAYEGGVELVICSDGAVFADAVGVSDQDVALYRADLLKRITSMGERRVRLFDLADAFGETSAEEARAALMAGYAMDVAEVRRRAKRSEVHARQLDGIHRFLFEDRRALDDTGASKSQLRKATRAEAYEVVRRSDAWGRLVSAVFPEAIRLSIHPQPDVSPKIGVHMIATEDAWLTPWHGCAVLRDPAGDARFSLMKRKEAEALGAITVQEDGRASYLEIPS